MNCRAATLAAFLASVAIPPQCASGALLHVSPGIAWNDCEGSANARTEMDFACDTNDGAPFQLVVTFELDPGDTISDFAVAYLVLNLAFLPADGATRPDWWAFYSGACRENAIQVVAPSAVAGVSCDDPYGPTGGGGLVQNWGFWCCNEVPTHGCDASGLGAQIRVEFATAGSETLVGGHRYVAAVLEIDRSLTVPAGGTSGCTGCSTPVKIFFSEMDIYRLSDGSTPSGFWMCSVPGPNPSAFWQQATVGARRESWGAIKALYR
jgi:hypothetical protein